MTKKSDKIAALKAEYPSLKVGSDETGYTDLNADEYEAKIDEWADNLLAKEAQEAQQAQEAAAKEALLTKLGITADEAKLLLS